MERENLGQKPTKIVCLDTQRAALSDDGEVLRTTIWERSQICSYHNRILAVVKWQFCVFIVEKCRGGRQTEASIEH
jgi:hypothetical protein